MNIEKHKLKSVDMIDKMISELSRIMQQASQDFDYDAGEERIRRWKARAVKLIGETIHPEESDNLLKKHAYLSGNKRAQEIVEENVRIYRGFILSLKDRIRRRPEEVFAQEILDESVSTPSAQSSEDLSLPSLPMEESQQLHDRKVFIVFGRDELNSLRLEKLLRYKGVSNITLINTIVYKHDHVAEKLEQEARWDSCAMFVFTQEDFVRRAGNKVPLARPEFLFSLGWFCGKYGHQRVCVLSRKGVKLPAGLADFGNIEFEDSVADVTDTINEKLLYLGFD